MNHLNRFLRPYGNISYYIASVNCLRSFCSESESLQSIFDGRQHKRISYIGSQSLNIDKLSLILLYCSNVTSNSYVNKLIAPSMQKLNLRTATDESLRVRIQSFGLNPSEELLSYYKSKNTWKLYENSNGFKCAYIPEVGECVDKKGNLIGHCSPSSDKYQIYVKPTYIDRAHIALVASGKLPADYSYRICRVNPSQKFNDSISNLYWSNKIIRIRQSDENNICSKPVLFTNAADPGDTRLFPSKAAAEAALGYSQGSITRHINFRSHLLFRKKWIVTSLADVSDVDILSPHPTKSASIEIACNGGYRFTDACVWNRSIMTKYGPIQDLMAECVLGRLLKENENVYLLDNNSHNVTVDNIRISSSLFVDNSKKRLVTAIDSDGNAEVFYSPKIVGQALNISRQTIYQRLKGTFTASNYVLRESTKHEEEFVFEKMKKLTSEEIMQCVDEYRHTQYYDHILQQLRIDEEWKSCVSKWRWSRFTN